ncbi:aminomethyl-transferring glycine dehydrogenase subunit GcvPA [bacterium]|nr:aminomethyl-transferring glycine dehydrogenase subunit GcvPA [bacterium]
MKYTQLSQEDINEMLQVVGISDIKELFKDIPENEKYTYKYLQEKGLTEIELRELFSNYAKSDHDILDYKSFLGGGFYQHFIPSIVYSILARSEFYTAYTPYQPEVSQGSLQMIFEFQSMISEITGLPISNASMYDGATAFTEAFLMAYRLFRGKKKKFLYAESVNPIYKNVLKTYMQFNPNFQMEEIPTRNGKLDIEYLRNHIDEDTAGVGISYPNFYGQIEDLGEIVKIIKDNKSIAIATYYPIVSSVLKTPGEIGFDIVVGNGQSLGNPIYFSGPTFGFFSTKMDFIRQMPGRLISETVDEDGKRGFVMTLQTREQHIRRERATSNICSNQTLNTLAAAVYLSFIGKHGFKKLGERILKLTAYAMQKFKEVGICIKYDPKRIFNEFVLDIDNSSEIVKKCLDKKIIAGISLEKLTDENGLLIAITEMNSTRDIDALIKAIKE